MLNRTDVRRPQGRGSYGGPIYPHQFLVPPPTGNMALVTLSPKFESFEVHWFKRMHRICTLPTGFCAPCIAGVPSIPLTYGFAQIEGTTSIGVLKLTARMIDMEPELGRLTTARGVQLRYYRYKNCPCGRPCVEVTGTAYDTSALPKAPDIEQWLLKTFSKTVLRDERRD